MSLNKKILFWVVGIVLALIAISLFYVNGRTESNDKGDNESIWVQNNTIYVEGVPVYRMVPVDGGEFLFGGYSDLLSISEQKIDRYLYTKKNVDSFIIGETPVTVALHSFALFGFPVKVLTDDKYALDTEENWMEFIEKLNQKTGRVFRLPTNEEWEYAARGGQKSKGYRFAGSDNIDEVAIYNWSLPQCVDSLESPSEFLGGRLKKPNELGLYDMSGGVWELTSSQLYETDFTFRFLYSAIMEKKKTSALNENEQFFIDLYTSSVCRGGDFSSEAKECSVDYISTTQPTLMGLRLVLEN